MTVLYHPKLSFLRLKGFGNYTNFYSIHLGLNPEANQTPFDTDIWIIVPLSSGEGGMR